jgi:hypothetical protein
MHMCDWVSKRGECGGIVNFLIIFKDSGASTWNDALLMLF